MLQKLLSISSNPFDLKPISLDVFSDALSHCFAVLFLLNKTLQDNRSTLLFDDTLVPLEILRMFHENYLIERSLSESGAAVSESTKDTIRRFPDDEAEIINGYIRIEPQYKETFDKQKGTAKTRLGDMSLQLMPGQERHYFFNLLKTLFTPIAINWMRFCIYSSQTSSESHGFSEARNAELDLVRLFTHTLRPSIKFSKLNTCCFHNTLTNLHRAAILDLSIIKTILVIGSGPAFWLGGEAEALMALCQPERIVAVNQNSKDTALEHLLLGNLEKQNRLPYATCEIYNKDISQRSPYKGFSRDRFDLIFVSNPDYIAKSTPIGNHSWHTIFSQVATRLKRDGGQFVITTEGHTTQQLIKKEFSRFRGIDTTTYVEETFALPSVFKLHSELRKTTPNQYDFSTEKNPYLSSFFNLMSEEYEQWGEYKYWIAAKQAKKAPIALTA